MTDEQLHRAADRAIDRAIRQVMADSTRMTARRAQRLRALAHAELRRLEQNLFANGEGIVRLDVDLLPNGGADRPPTLLVMCGRLPSPRWPSQ